MGFVESFLQAVERLDAFPSDELAARAKAMREAESRWLPLPEEGGVAAWDAFFTDDVLADRVLICPEINRDMTDDAGVFGYEAGFLYIVGVWPTWKEPNTIGERSWLQNRAVTFRAGVPCGLITSFDWFPRGMLKVTPITPEREPVLYAFLRKRLGRHALEAHLT